MNVLACGSGIIGSLLIHKLAQAGNDVTVLARGNRLRELQEHGLRTKARSARHAERDEVRAVESIPTGEHFDLAFSVMQYTQQWNLLEDLGRTDCDTVVLVGNNMSATEMQRRILEAAAQAGRPHKTVLFGFQGTGGTRQDGYIETLSFGKPGMTVGALSCEAPQPAKDLLTRTFAGSNYRLTWMDDMDAWYKCHLAFVIPICYLCYACGCDLRTSTRTQRRLCLDAAAQLFDALADVGCAIRPEGEDAYYRSGPKRAFMDIMMFAMAKTSLGDHAASNHCKHAVSEMEVLAGELERLVEDARTDLSRYRELKALSPTWDELRRTWG